MEISLYHFTREPLEKSLPRLMEKVYATGKRAVIMAQNDEQVDMLNKGMWTFATAAFIPHGSQEDGFPEDQPIWLTTKQENPNGAEIIVLTNNIETDYIANFKRCLDVFDGNDVSAVQLSKQRITNYKNKQYTITYWLQGAKGNWDKQEI